MYIIFIRRKKERDVPGPVTRDLSPIYIILHTRVNPRGPSFPLVKPSIRPLFLVVAAVAATSAGLLEKSAIYILCILLRLLRSPYPYTYTV